MEFDYDAYLTTANSKPVEHESFKHVETSLRTYIPENSICEVETGENSCWFAHIKFICDQLFYLSYLDPGQPDPALRYTWLDLRHSPLRRFGFARDNKKLLRPARSEPAAGCGPRESTECSGASTGVRSEPMESTECSGASTGVRSEPRESTECNGDSTGAGSEPRSGAGCEPRGPTLSTGPSDSTGPSESTVYSGPSESTLYNGPIEPSLYIQIEVLVRKHNWNYLLQDLPTGSKTSVYSLVKPGFQYELQEEFEPTKFWVVSVSQNHGGLLGLSYASPELRPRTDLRLFLTHPRLHPCGTVNHSNGKYQFKVPDKLRAMGYPPPVWKVLKTSFSDVSGKNVLLEKWLGWSPPESHSFLEKMLLAVIDPRCQQRFRVAIVEKIIDQTYFRISLLEESEVRLVCSRSTQEIGSIPWAIHLGLLDKQSLQDMACSPQSKIAPRSLFLNHSALAQAQFHPGEKLEFLAEQDLRLFNLATVLEVKEHILKVQIVSLDCCRDIYLGCGSSRLYPLGWSQANGLELQVPAEILSSSPQPQPTSTLPSHPTSTLLPQPTSALQPQPGSILQLQPSSHLQPQASFILQPQPSSPLQSQPSSPLQPQPALSRTSRGGSLNAEPTETGKPSLKGFWCPPIYFNHLCYSASFMRRPRLEALPKYIGPGPVRLVMREVISKLVGFSFKSGAVLKKLEVGEMPRPDFWLETMKGKSRVLLLEGKVEVPSRAEQVVEFCREVCQKLECCPYLFGPTSVGGECPSACQTRPKHEFLLEPAKPSKLKGRRGKKRSRKVGEQNGLDEKGGGESSSDDTSATPSYATTREPSREQSPDRDGPPPLKRRSVSDPVSGAVASLLQLKVKPTRKEMEEMEELIEESLRESPPSTPSSRPPSPKLLRSRISVPASLSAAEPEPLLNLDLDAAFSYEDLAVPPIMMEPPPVYKIILKSNPVLWTAVDVAEFISCHKDKEISALSSAMKEEQMDGMALLLLNLPTILDHWRIKFSTAYNLCRLVEAVKLAFYVQFAHTRVSVQS